MPKKIGAHTLRSPWASVRENDSIPFRISSSRSAILLTHTPANFVPVLHTTRHARATGVFFFGGGPADVSSKYLAPPSRAAHVCFLAEHRLFCVQCSFTAALAAMRVCGIVLLLSAAARGLVTKAGSESRSERPHLPQLQDKGAPADLALTRAGLYCRGGSSAARGAGAAGWLGKQSVGKGGLPAAADADKPWGAKQGWGQLRRSPEARTSSSTKLVSARGACACSPLLLCMYNARLLSAPPALITGHLLQTAVVRKPVVVVAGVPGATLLSPWPTFFKPPSSFFLVGEDDPTIPRGIITSPTSSALLGAIGVLGGDVGELGGVLCVRS